MRGEGPGPGTPRLHLPPGSSPDETRTHTYTEGRGRHQVIRLLKRCPRCGTRIHVQAYQLHRLFCGEDGNTRADRIHNQRRVSAQPHTHKLVEPCLETHGYLKEGRCRQPKDHPGRHLCSSCGYQWGGQTGET